MTALKYEEILFWQGELMEYTTNVGDYLIIQITGSIATYIAEVTQHEPLQMKVLEDGPFAHLKDGDYIILEKDTEQYQKDLREQTEVYIAGKMEKHQKVLTGLASLGAPASGDTLFEVEPD